MKRVKKEKFMTKMNARKKYVVYVILRKFT